MSYSLGLLWNELAENILLFTVQVPHSEVHYIQIMFFSKIIFSGGTTAALTRTEYDHDYEAMKKYYPQFLIKDLLKRLNRKNGSGVLNNDFMEAVRNMTAFEKDLLRINSPDEDYKLYNVSQLSKKYAFLNWEDFFHNLFTEFDLNSPINQSTEVLVQVHTCKISK